MAGTVSGGKAAAITNMQRQGKDFYRRIGRLGGKKGTTGGFYHAMITGQNWHKEAGRKGGTISRKKRQFRDEL